MNENAFFLLPVPPFSPDNQTMKIQQDISAFHLIIECVALCCVGLIKCERKSWNDKLLGAQFRAVGIRRSAFDPVNLMFDMNRHGVKHLFLLWGSAKVFQAFRTFLLLVKEARWIVCG